MGGKMRFKYYIIQNTHLVKSLRYGGATLSNWSYFSKAFFLPNGSGITLYRQCKPLKLSFKELRKKIANSFLNEEMLKGSLPSLLPQALMYEKKIYHKIIKI